MFNIFKMGNVHKYLEKKIDELSKRLEDHKENTKWEKEKVALLLNHVVELETKDKTIKHCPCCNEPMKLNVEFGVTKDIDHTFLFARYYQDNFNLTYSLSCENGRCVAKPQTRKFKSLDILLNKWNKGQLEEKEEEKES